jgi:misacylated tRNA(Ala) deacylase
VTTDPLYQRDAYERSFEASVTAVRDGALALDRTAFYPGGGGQPCDTGTLTSDGRILTVTETFRDGDDIWHRVEGDPPSENTEVRGALDWDRRYDLMRTHTAMHILCGVVWRDHGAKVTGGNMQPLKGRMDFEFEKMKAELVGEIEERINAEVTASRSISVEFLARNAADEDPALIRTKVNLLPADITEVRVVDIDGLDRQADGGTHVDSTGEVGRIRIVNYKSKGRANKRLEIELDPAPADRGA